MEASFDAAKEYGLQREVMLWSLCGAVEVARVHRTWSVEKVLARALTDALVDWDC